jgi:hypothetical protein
MSREPEIRRPTKLYDNAHPEQDRNFNHIDPTKFPSMHSRNLILGGAIVILGLILGGLILGYNVIHTETQRAGSVPSSSAVPLRP